MSSLLARLARPFLSGAVLLSLLGASGCTTREGRAAVAAVELFGAIVVAASEVQAMTSSREVVYTPPVREISPGAPGSPFDEPALRSALRDVDLAPCRAAGAPPGVGYARVSYAGPGWATRVHVAEPRGLPDAAAACVGERLAVRVPAFDGPEMTVGVRYVVP